MRGNKQAHFAERRPEEAGQRINDIESGQEQESSMAPGVRWFLVLLGLGALLVGLLPGGCAAGGIYWYSVNRSFMHGAELIEAELAEYREESKDGSPMYRPIFTYEYDGKEYTHRAFWRSSNKAYAEGDSVHMYVLPDDPEEAMLDHWTSKYLGPAILAVPGLILLSVCWGAAALFFVLVIRGG